MRQFNRKILSFVFAGLFLLVSYQNCGDVRLAESIVPVPERPFSNSGNICSIPALSSTDKVRILFVVDMSASNVAPGSLGEEGSDLTGRRFDAIESFLQADCIKDNENAKVALIGFANNAKLLTGTSCDKNQFQEFDQIQDELQFFRAMDEQTSNDCSGSSPTGNCTSFTTDYREGVNCAERIVNSDISTPDADDRKSFYMTFFLTDGEPKVANLDFSSTASSQYRAYKAQTVETINRVRNRAEDDALGLQFQPIFYGGEYLSRVDSTGGKQDLANDILTEMAEAGLTQYKLLNSIGDLNLCELMASGNRVPYRIKQFVVTNLTSAKIGTRLLADSDVDGIPDIYEEIRGFDPRNPRSMSPNNNLLDGACGGLGFALCNDTTAYRDCGTPNAIGLTRCEVNKLGLVNGLDSEPEPDSFLDIMELVKGTALNDGVGVDDGDSRSEFEELMMGRDPNVPDDDTPLDYLVQFERSLLANPIVGCTPDQESIHYRIDQVPLVKTLATNFDDPVSNQVPWLAHGENDNIVFIYYILTPANQQLRGELREQVYGQFLKVNYYFPNINVGAFEKLGEIAPSFEESRQR